MSGNWVGRSLLDGFHLNLRCDGQAYDGCQAACLIFWKGAWLKPLSIEESPQRPAAANEGRSEEVVAGSTCVENDVWRATRCDAYGRQPSYWKALTADRYIMVRGCFALAVSIRGGGKSGSKEFLSALLGIMKTSPGQRQAMATKVGAVNEGRQNVLVGAMTCH